MTWTRLRTHGQGRRHSGLRLWLRTTTSKLGVICMTPEVVAWLASERVAVHADEGRGLVAIAPSTCTTDPKITSSNSGRDHKACCSSLAATFPALAGNIYTLTEANEPAIGRCLLFSVHQADAGADPEAAKYTPQTRVEGRAKVREYVDQCHQSAKPISASACREIGAAHGLTAGESTAVMNQAIDGHMPAKRRP